MVINYVFHGYLDLLRDDRGGDLCHQCDTLIRPPGIVTGGLWEILLAISGIRSFAGRTDETLVLNQQHRGRDH